MATLPIVRENVEPRSLRSRLAGVAERALAALLLAIALPILVVSALTIAVLSRRTPLIMHKRMGYRGATLWMLKLRTMWSGTKSADSWIERIDDDRGPAMKQAADPRVTHPFARFCRRHSIDELPQLWHVVRGEMSLVGPRPMTLAELRRYYGDDAEEILQVKPGLAGLWQISGRNRLSYAERRRMDLMLVREGGLCMYFSILLRTIPEVFHGENSW